MIAGDERKEEGGGKGTKKDKSLSCAKPSDTLACILIGTCTPTREEEVLLKPELPFEDFEEEASGGEASIWWRGAGITDRAGIALRLA